MPGLGPATERPSVWDDEWGPGECWWGHTESHRCCYHDINIVVQWDVSQCGVRPAAAHPLHHQSSGDQPQSTSTRHEVTSPWSTITDQSELSDWTINQSEVRMRGSIIKLCCLTIVGVVVANPDAKRLYSNLLANYDRSMILINKICWLFIQILIVNIY